MSSLKTKAFEKQTYLSLETFRKNGQGVPTPVWFAESNGILYITTTTAARAATKGIEARRACVTHVKSLQEYHKELGLVK